MHKDEREQRRHERKLDEPGKLGQAPDGMDGMPRRAERIEKKADSADGKNVHVHFQGADRLRHSGGGDDVNRVGEGRTEHERDSRRAEHGTVACAHQKNDPRNREANRNDRFSLQLFLEEKHHEDCDHDGIRKEDRRGDARIHKEKAQVETKRGRGKEKSQKADVGNVFPRKAKVLAEKQNEQRAQNRRAGEPVKENGTGGESRLVKVESAERICPVADGGKRAIQKTAMLRLHGAKYRKLSAGMNVIF